MVMSTLVFALIINSTDFLPSIVFVFIDLMADEQSNLPKELSEKYMITKKIGV